MEKKTRGPRNAAKTKLKALRISKKATQKIVAEAANINERTFQFYEQGTKLIDNANLETILKLCLVLECKIEDIIESEELLELLHKYQDQ